ncbi:MAG: hypothetical protein HRT92_06900 [Piscirickettsiaceae bacterium]|nr:hypothetical protein [Piscirickettsiaceae bacterium]
MKEQHNLSLIDSDIISEWLYFAVLAEHSSDSITQLITLTLASSFLEHPIISEAEIDAAIDMDLTTMKEEISKNVDFEHQYKASVNRESIRQELINAGAGEQFEEGLAACEFLTALMGAPSKDFLAVSNSYGDDFITTLQNLTQQCNNTDLLALIPKALSVINKSKENPFIKSRGLTDKNDIARWKISMTKLANKLSQGLGNHSDVLPVQ